MAKAICIAIGEDERVDTRRRRRDLIVIAPPSRFAKARSPGKSDWTP